MAVEQRRPECGEGRCRTNQGHFEKTVFAPYQNIILLVPFAWRLDDKNDARVFQGCIVNRQRKDSQMFTSDALADWPDPIAAYHLHGSCHCVVLTGPRHSVARVIYIQCW